MTVSVQRPTRRAAAQTEHLLKPLDSYHRQYAGYLQGGRRFVYLNAFQMRPWFEKHWREHPIVVGDGGVELLRGRV